MEGTSKWVKWYQILAVIGCAVIALFSITSGWKASSYFSYHREEHNMAVFLTYAGIGCVIAAAELLLSMMLCEFLDNVSFIVHKLSDWDYSKAAKQFIDELARNPKAKELGVSVSKTEQSAAKKEPQAPGTEKSLPSSSSLRRRAHRARTRTTRRSRRPGSNRTKSSALFATQCSGRTDACA